MSEVTGDGNRIGLTGATREAFVKTEFDSCSSKSLPPTYCSCYADAMADSISVKELKEITAPGSREAGMNALLPKIAAVGKRCR